MLMLLLVCVGLPVITAALLMLFRGSMAADTARWIALVGAVATMLASFALLAEFERLPVPIVSANTPIQPRFEYQRPWFSASPNAPADKPGISMKLHLGLDGISMTMIVLTTILSVSSILISWEAIKERQVEYYAALLALQAGVIGVFCSFDLVLFYVFFEITLIPLFFLIAIWGGPQRRYAAVKFFLYTLFASLITLVGLVALVLQASKSGLATPTSLPALASWFHIHPLDPQMQLALFLAISAGFLVKVPVFPFHTWLPLAHVEAPTAGSVLLAGVLLKLGTYGFLRLCVPMFPEACLTVGIPMIGILSVIGIIYGSLCSLAQRDIKKLVAYSSVAHLGFCMLGIFALNAEGLAGGVLQMINHGLSTGALFLLVGMVYERYHTRQIDDLGGLAAKLPLLACCMVFISMASIGLPGLNGFTGEFLSLAGMFKRHPMYAVLGSTGVVLGAWYLLTMLQFVFFGPLKEPAHGEPHITDINLREMLALAPLAVLCLWIGVYPKPVLDMIRPDVEAMAALYPQPADPVFPAPVEHAQNVPEHAGQAALASQ